MESGIHHKPVIWAGSLREGIEARLWTLLPLLSSTSFVTIGKLNEGNCMHLSLPIPELFPYSTVKI